MSMALTNQERFVAACQIEGGAGVRNKLNTGRYSEAKTIWASNWLEQVDGGKSDATRAQEGSTRLLNAKEPGRRLVAIISLMLVMVAVAAAVFLLMR